VDVVDEWMLALNMVLHFKIISQEHILGFTTYLYDYVLTKKNVYDQWLLSC